jgi:6-phosphofructo-2-kinase/fructose-2,6-biphosphatase 4
MCLLFIIHTFSPSPSLNKHKLADPEAMSKRTAAAEAALNDMLAFFDQGGQVGIFDTTLTVMEDRRTELVQRLSALKIQVVFVETICNNPSVVSAHIREVKLSMPDYAGWPEDQGIYLKARRNIKTSSHTNFYFQQFKTSCSA